MSNTFTEIKAKFTMVGKTERGNEYRYDIEIERKESGANAYGDRSCHLLNLYDHDTKEWLRDDFYDTRYDHISTYKPSWVKVWKNFIKNNWINVQSVELVEWEEKEVELRKR
jgi:hypothetical protein